MRTLSISLACLLTAGFIPREAVASVTAITNKQQWLDLVGHHTFIGFTEYPEFTTITTQYASLGVVFPDGNDFISESGAYGDNHGLVGVDPTIPGRIGMSFDLPRYAIAFDHTDRTQVELYSNDQLIFSSILYSGGFTPFIGFVSTVPFDRALALDPIGLVVTLDNIYFGPPIPAAPALAALALAALFPTSRRRRS